MKFLRTVLFTLLVSVFAASASFSAVAAEAININTADAATLAKNLNGVGLKKAEAIVAYRTKNGNFKTANDLSKVKGIGNKTVARNKDYILIGKASH